MTNRINRIDYAAQRAAAMQGRLPPAPDMSAKTHDTYRHHLVTLIEARDFVGLVAYDFLRKNSSREMLGRFQDDAIIALHVQEVLAMGNSE